MLFYRAALPLSPATLTYAAGIIRRHRKSIGSRWRRLNPGKQALLVLAYLRKGETFAQLAAGFAVGTTTAWRYVEETVALLAARAPKLRKYGSVISLWVEFGGESALVVAAAGVALVEPAPVGPVVDVVDGAQLGPERGDDQAVEQAADLGGGQRDRPAVAGIVPGIGGPGRCRGRGTGHQEGQGEHGQGDEPVPASPGAHLVVIQPCLVFGCLESFLHRPAHPGDMDQGGQRHRGR